MTEQPSPNAAAIEAAVKSAAEHTSSDHLFVDAVKGLQSVKLTDKDYEDLTKQLQDKGILPEFEEVKGITKKGFKVADKGTNKTYEAVSTHSIDEVVFDHDEKTFNFHQPVLSEVSTGSNTYRLYDDHTRAHSADDFSTTDYFKANGESIRQATDGSWSWRTYPDNTILYKEGKFTFAGSSRLTNISLNDNGNIASLGTAAGTRDFHYDDKGLQSWTWTPAGKNGSNTWTRSADGKSWTLATKDKNDKPTADAATFNGTMSLDKKGNFTQKEDGKDTYKVEKPDGSSVTIDKKTDNVKSVVTSRGDTRAFELDAKGKLTKITYTSKGATAANATWTFEGNKWHSTNADDEIPDSIKLDPTDRGALISTYKDCTLRERTDGGRLQTYTDDHKVFFSADGQTTTMTKNSVITEPTTKTGEWEQTENLFDGRRITRKYNGTGDAQKLVSTVTATLNAKGEADVNITRSEDGTHEYELVNKYNIIWDKERVKHIGNRAGVRDFTYNDKGELLSWTWEGSTQGDPKYTFQRSDSDATAWTIKYTGADHKENQSTWTGTMTVDEKGNLIQSEKGKPTVIETPDGAHLYQNDKKQITLIVRSNADHTSVQYSYDQSGELTQVMFGKTSKPDNPSTFQATGGGKKDPGKPDLWHMLDAKGAPTNLPDLQGIISKPGLDGSHIYVNTYTKQKITYTSDDRVITVFADGRTVTTDGDIEQTEFHPSSSAQANLARGTHDGTTTGGGKGANGDGNDLANGNGAVDAGGKGHTTGKSDASGCYSGNGKAAEWWTAKRHEMQKTYADQISKEHKVTGGQGVILWDIAKANLAASSSTAESPSNGQVYREMLRLQKLNGFQPCTDLARVKTIRLDAGAESVD